MLISELSRMVHQNAVEHGWWDEERSPEEVVALIHSEWSEALEEARASRPMKWYACMEGDEHFPCAPADETECLNFSDRFNCKWRGKKPEGIAVELIDGCIRILDYMGRMQTELSEDGKDSTIESLYSDGNVNRVPEKVSELIAYLHLYTSQAIAARSFHDLRVPDMFALTGAMAAALSWVKKQGINPLPLLLEKHEYNKSRPYKHGKKF